MNKFGVFVALNAILLIRPEELFPAITGLRLYLIAISICTLLALPDLLSNLSSGSLRSRPISCCVLLYFASSIVSLLFRGRTSEALLDFGPEFAKVILYYFLLISIVDTPERFRAFVSSLVVLIAVLAAIALAQKFEIVAFPNIEPVMQRDFDPASGEEIMIPRLVSSGIFNDPNDLCLILGLGIVSCLYLASTGTHPPPLRMMWLAPIALFAFAVIETHSRGGLMGVLTGIAAFLYSRFGGARSLLLAVPGAAAMLALIGGRQGNIGGGGTAHERVMMWAEGLSELFNRPLYIPTGLGTDWFVEANGLVAHNSYVQAYVEQGVVGGGAFLGAFLLASYCSDRFGRAIPAESWVLSARPLAFASLCGYAIGCFSLSRNLVLPTYLVLGLAASLVESPAVALPESLQVTTRCLFRGLGISFIGLIVLKYATQFLGMAGV